LSTVLGYLRTATAPREEARAGEDGPLERFIARREEAAFATLLQQHGPMVLAVCRRILHSDHDAEDAFQATFLVLARRAAAIGKRQALASWLHGVALRTALKRRAALARRRKHERQATPMAHAEPDGDVVWTDLRRVLDEEVDRLPEKYRTPVVLCYLEGRTYEEAARRLGCALGTLSTRLTRARGLLRQSLARRGVGLTAGGLGVLLTSHAAPAAVPPLLAAQALQAALLFAAGISAAGAASGEVLTLTHGVLQAMSRGKLKTTLLTVLTVCLLSGLGALAYQSLGAAALPAVQGRYQEDRKSELAVRSQPPKQKELRALALEEALKAAGEIKDDLARITALADIAAAQVKGGDKKAGARTFELALEGADKLKGDRAALALARIARAQAEAGNLQTAAQQNFERAWKAAADSERWTEIHPDIGILQLEAGFTAEGWKKLEETFARIGGVRSNNLRSKIIQFQLRTGDLAGAAVTVDQMLELADGPGLGTMEADVLVEFTEAMLKQPKSKRKVLTTMLKMMLERLAAVGDIGRVPAPQYVVLNKPYALASVAIIESKLDQKKEALAHVRQARAILVDNDIPAEDWPLAMKVDCLAKVAEAEHALGDTDAARKTLKDAQSLLKDKGDFRDWAVFSIAEAQLYMRDWQAALKTAQSLGWRKDQFLQKLAHAQTAAGQAKEVMAWASKADLPLLRARAYLGVARGLEPAGQVNPQRRTR
jgi:RNA polymerase sigma factor (sigma-70 family)